jgi:putative aminopeptidase FrvX
LPVTIPCIWERIVLLEKFSNVCAAAGDEEDIRAAIKEEITDCVDEISTNPLGNLIIRKSGEKSSSSILLTAHMDEVACIVKSVEKNGLIKFHTIGGIVGAILPGNPVAVGRNRVPGVVACKSYHIMPEEERKRVPEVKDLCIDIGAGSREEVKDISCGDYIYFRSKFFTQNGCFYGKAFDDRAGCAALCELFREYGKGKPPLEIVGTFCAQEEVGLRGGATAAFGLQGLLFNLNLEGTTCSDRELKKSYSPVTELGRGPAITFMDRTTITNRKLFEFVVSVAEKEGIPFQLKRGTAGGTDAGLIHLTEEGVPSVTVSVPVRYIHSPWCIMSGEDFQSYIALAKAVVHEAPVFSL